LLRTANNKDQSIDDRQKAITELLQYINQDYYIQVKTLEIAKNEEKNSDLRVAIIQGFQAVENLAPDAGKILQTIAAEATDSVVKQAAQDYLARKLTAERGR
jgi:cobalamin biosynthesis protein CbiG